MDVVSVALGVAAIAFGCYTIYVRARNPSRFGKLAAMQERFGDKPGTLIHVFAYSLVPIGFGIVSLALGFRGRSILGQ